MKKQDKSSKADQPKLVVKKRKYFLPFFNKSVQAVSITEAVEKSKKEKKEK